MIGFLGIANGRSRGPEREKCMNRGRIAFRVYEFLEKRAAAKRNGKRLPNDVLSEFEFGRINPKNEELR